jgi:hypothetical protein
MAGNRVISNFTPQMTPSSAAGGESQLSAKTSYSRIFSIAIVHHEIS